jgi:hypothetical protein
MTTTSVQIQKDTFNQLLAEQIRRGNRLTTALEVMGERFGFYGVMSDRGPVTGTELSDATGVPLECAVMWLETQRATDRVDYVPATARYSLWCPWPREQ